MHVGLLVLVGACGTVVQYIRRCMWNSWCCGAVDALCGFACALVRLGLLVYVVQ